MDLGAVSLQVLGVEDAFGGAGQQLRQHALAFGKPGPAQIEPIEIEQVKRVIEQPVLAARGQIGVQQSEVRNASRIRDDGFAIRDQILRRQGCERIGDGSEAQRPIIACAGVDGRLAVSQVRLCPVAVELDLVNPASA
jgi:hypothetical protein